MPRTACHRFTLTSATLRVVALLAAGALFVGSSRYVGGQTPPALPSATESNRRDDAKISLTMIDVPIMILVGVLGRAASTTVHLQGDIDANEKVSVDARDMPLSELLDQVVKDRPWMWRFNDEANIYEVWNKASFNGRKISPTNEATVALQHAEAVRLSLLIDLALDKSNGGTIQHIGYDTIVVRGPKDFIEDVLWAIEHCDVPLDASLSQELRVLRVNDGNFSDAVRRMEQCLSPHGSLIANERARLVVAIDAKQNIQRVQIEARMGSRSIQSRLAAARTAPTSSSLAKQTDDQIFLAASFVGTFVVLSLSMFLIRSRAQAAAAASNGPRKDAAGSQH